MMSTLNAPKSFRLPEVIENHRPTSSPEFDPSTNSNYLNFNVFETSLDIAILFDQKIVKGDVTYILSSNTSAANQIILDTSFLKINGVSINNQDLGSNDYFLKQRSEPLGSPLIINNIDKANFIEDNEITLKISFETTKDCTALQFLDSKNTDGKDYPYLFSQSEAIHSRSIFPCFDTPSIKTPYKIKVTSPLPTLTSALVDNTIHETEKTENTYYFYQPIPIPAYLFAIVSGNVVGKKIGERSTIYSEPIKIDECANEFKDNIMENFIRTIEQIVFDYKWTNYDFVICPIAFPYGGMENPQLTLANSTIISGDGENIDVIAHELAHSYSGNLVTNCSWEHFWLNEGWTVYLERRIIGAIHGEASRHFSAIIGWSDLETSIKAMENKNQLHFSKLIQNLKNNKDPDDAFSTVPYEKGFNLLFYLENLLGGVENFDPFIKYYFNKFNEKSLDTYQFIDTLYEFFNTKKYHDLLNSIDWETWLYKEGLPPKPKFDTSLVNKCYDLSDKWIKFILDNNKTNKILKFDDFYKKFNINDVEEFSSNQNVVFLDTLTGFNEKIDKFQWSNTLNGQIALKAMKKIYSNYEKSGNAEVIFRWYRLLLTGRIKEDYQTFADWLGTVGRMKFVRPGYILLKECDEQLAIETFEKFKNNYHPICVALVKKDLGI
ncbi:bifunctional aminopeptidase/epoxide hydrolase [Ascoidea rubescens DSM 1968]|uniref:Leukotriene A(4) hydrolase n=1 Tax=Ascoidea rubescens DSM 1968 TaxID=1344418 RepID=A0A1D2VI37_9ASCO|nr:leukotriene-A4 hydrolase [Ascoidea rubescens DSM 1968]ODV61200.1 leukotriene-A4 hydrolase [Ascoidea rubescens DSM 1968]